MLSLKLTSIGLMVLALSACGGGGGGGGGEEPPATSSTFSLSVESVNVTQISTSAPLSVDTSAVDSGNLEYTF